MSNKISKAYLCKYLVQSLVLMYGSEYIQMDMSNILSIEYFNDYELNIRAILKVSLRIDIRKKIWILRNKENILAKFELDKIGMDIETEDYVTSPESVWNGIFNIYFNDEDDSTDVNVLEQRIKLNEGAEFRSNDISTENYFETQNTLDIYLFNQRLLDSSNIIVNDVITSDIMQQIVGKLLTDTKHQEVTMSAFENDEVYEELLIPANPLYKALIYLDQYYGFYRKGAMIYYDIDRLFILNTKSGCTAKRTGEYPETTIMITGIDTSSPGNGVIRREGEKVHYATVPEMYVSNKSFTDTNNVNFGSDTQVVVSDDITIDSSEANQSYTGERKSAIIYTKKGDNKYAAEILKARMEENECILYITASNLDINAFTPNKVFQVVFEETNKQQLFGAYKYRLVYAYHVLKLESTYMSSIHYIILKRCSSDDYS